MAGIEFQIHEARDAGMSLCKRFVLPAFLTLGNLLPIAASADETSIAVASNFMAPMNAIIAAFEKESGHKVKAAFGSSGKLYAQIRNGAPFQIFFSADEEKPLVLEKEELTVPGSGFTYAIGRLVLWSAKPGLAVSQAKVLKQGGFNKLAIANPRHAPYGTAALEVLRHLEISESIEAKLVQGENIAQAYQFVETGNAELGLVALSQIMELRQGSAWIVPAGLHSPIRQSAVLLKSGTHNEAARELLRFIRGARAKSIIVSYGYQVETE